MDEPGLDEELVEEIEVRGVEEDGLVGPRL